ncbi:hypothetical protein FHW18_000280 [Pigmentiphaga litoralis]|uniref:Uncharacterized protein n=1 Tax=Pigmentiphaga litoralis TaxID=516702 RepID=A0A7Y9IQA5_9BURK|nr:hypothetical protein [Pigmentiphaga litoralis]NYE81009.1 hypothetical protein [Pigmentiphaga litoralis]
MVVIDTNDGFRRCSSHSASRAVVQPSTDRRMSAARSSELTVSPRSGQWASRACSRGAVCRRFKPWAHLGIVERRPLNSQAGRALPGPSCGPPRWPRPRWPAWAVSRQKSRNAWPSTRPWCWSATKKLLVASGRRTRAAGGVSRIRCDSDTFTNCRSSQQLVEPYTPTTLIAAHYLNEHQLAAVSGRRVHRLERCP